VTSFVAFVTGFVAYILKLGNVVKQAVPDHLVEIYRQLRVGGIICPKISISGAFFVAWRHFSLHFVTGFVAFEIRVKSLHSE
jgi:hypothetical protein